MKHFTTIKFEGHDGLFDYPKELPLPRIGEHVIFNGKFGTVTDIRHLIEETFIEINILCSKHGNTRNSA